MPERRSYSLTWVVFSAAGLLAVAIAVVVWIVQKQNSNRPGTLDPAAWGDDHVGQEHPEYVTGEQCLFCHREKIGPSWAKNRHHLTIREAEALPPALEAIKTTPARSVVQEIKYVMGNKHAHRFLKPSQEYGHLELLSVQWTPPLETSPGKLSQLVQPQWNSKQFATSCAGCHTTAVDSKTQAFSSLSIDCYACHGNVAVEHPNKPELAHLSSRRKDSAIVITSICAQCHVRSGESKSTGLPYPNTFIAGDNLFRDFKVDFTDMALKELSSADHHIVENVRDVVMYGKESISCLSCHEVHRQSTRKHRLLPRANYCMHCHNPTGPMIDVKPTTSGSKTCGY